MEKKIAGLLGAVAALGAVNAAQAAPTPQVPSGISSETLTANSFTELLEPIPNAAVLLRAVDQTPPAPSVSGNVQLAQYYRHHHHHHHHHFWRRYRHHHHHHHHHGYYRYY